MADIDKMRAEYMAQHNKMMEMFKSMEEAQRDSKARAHTPLAPRPDDPDGVIYIRDAQ